MKVVYYHLVSDSEFEFFNGLSREVNSYRSWSNFNYGIEMDLQTNIQKEKKPLFKETIEVKRIQPYE